MTKDPGATISERALGAREATHGRGERRPRARGTPTEPGVTRPDVSPATGVPGASQRGAGPDGAQGANNGSKIRALRFDAFRLDMVNQCLWRGGARIELTPKAFAVLRYLVEHPGRLVMQQELLEALWPGIYVQPEILKTYIRDLRKLLGDDARAPRFIETRARRGYRFIAAVSDDSSRPPGALPVSPRPPVTDLDRLSDVLVPAARDGRGVSSGTDRTTRVDALQRLAATQALLWTVVSQFLPARPGRILGHGGPTPHSAPDERQHARTFLSAGGRRHDVRGFAPRRSPTRPRHGNLELVWSGGRPLGERRPPA